MKFSPVRPLAATRLTGVAIIVFFSPVPTCSALVSNAPENPQSLTQVICANRNDGRSECEVELDVPSACVSDGESSCPIVFFLHGSGGTNDWFSRTTGVHSAGLIGVYPNGERGWNTGPKETNLCSWDDFSCTSGRRLHRIDHFRDPFPGRPRQCIRDRKFKWRRACPS